MENNNTEMLLGANDMAKLGCNDCAGCSDCCRGMGDSILLDPYDIYMLQAAVGQTFSQLLRDPIDLHVEDGLILPAIRMQEDTDACGFLSKDGRCSIHSHRPGLCRLFPLGRNYDEQGLRYFVLEDACRIGSRTKVKIKKWLEIGQLPKYEQFLTVWHDLKKRIQEQIAEHGSDEYAQKANVVFLETFYQTPYDTEQDFYLQFDSRLANERIAGIIGGSPAAV